MRNVNDLGWHCSSLWITCHCLDDASAKLLISYDSGFSQLCSEICECIKSWYCVPSSLPNETEHQEIWAIHKYRTASSIVRKKGEKRKPSSGIILNCSWNWTWSHVVYFYLWSDFQNDAAVGSKLHLPAPEQASVCNLQHPFEPILPFLTLYTVLIDI